MVGNRDLDEIAVVLPGVLHGVTLVELSPRLLAWGIFFSVVAVWRSIYRLAPSL